MCARGVFAVHEYLVITMCSTPSVASASAAGAPAGPLPMTRPSVPSMSFIPTLLGFDRPRACSVADQDNNTKLVALRYADARGTGRGGLGAAASVTAAPARFPGGAGVVCQVDQVYIWGRRCSSFRSLAD